MPSIKWNSDVWGRDYTWPQHGDEWSDMANFCNIPYDMWKDSVAREFFFHIINTSNVLEIGCGHGRWSSLIAPKVPQGHLDVVDLNKSCIEFCKEKLAQYSNINYWQNDGKNLNFIADSSIDFIWSFDTFVHIEEPEVKMYAKELYRTMKRQAMGIIHHSGSPTDEQRRNGMRSLVDKVKFRDILLANRLHIVRQIDSWGNGCNVKFANDIITIFVKP